jgi:hypothetical protein
MLAALGLTAVALVWARLASEDHPPLDLLQIGLVILGVVAAGVGVWQRCAWPGAPGLDNLAPGFRGRILLLLGLDHALIALAVSLVLVLKFNVPDLPGQVGGWILLWLLAAPWCAWSSWRLLQRSQDGAPLGPALETATLVTQGGLCAFMGSWACYWGPALSGEWDSMRLFLAVLSAMAFLGGAIAAAPPRQRRLAVSGLIVLHFAAIGSVVIGQPPGPWIMQMTQHWITGKYLDFMYLNNGYRFYSPEPSPASQLWCRIEYLQGKTRLSRWMKLPDMDDRGNPKYPAVTLGLQYTRRLALTESVARSEPPPPMLVRDANGEMVLAPFAQRRDDQAPVPMRKRVLGEKTPPNPAGIPMHPDPTVPGYQKPSFEGLQLLSSYARHILAMPHPTLPDAKPVTVKIYRVQHRILTAELLNMGMDPWDLTFYLPYYVGAFDAQGRLLDPDEPFLYWVLPIIPQNENDPRSPLLCYVFKHAGDTDEKDWKRLR